MTNDEVKTPRMAELQQAVEARLAWLSDQPADAAK